jgi:prepilin-type processing-associated H-X9-DG protein
VVISIIALLIAILLPALGRARTTARAVACLSNHRQLALATQMYAMDSRDWLPPAKQFAAFGTIPPYTLDYRSVASDYLTSTSVWKCPNSPIQEDRHYSTNPAVMREYRTGDPLNLRQSDLGRHSSVVMLVDGNFKTGPWVQTQAMAKGIDRPLVGGGAPWGLSYDPASATLDDPVGLGPNAPDAGAADIRWREAGALGTDGEALGNFLFADGHARTIAHGNLLRGQLRPDRLPWNLDTP